MNNASGKQSPNLLMQQHSADRSIENLSPDLFGGGSLSSVGTSPSEVS